MLRARTSWKRRDSTGIRPQYRLVPHIWRASACSMHLAGRTGPQIVPYRRGKAARARANVPTTLLPRTIWDRQNSTSIRPLSHTSGGLVPHTLRAPKSHRSAGGRLRSEGARVRTRTTPPPPRDPIKRTREAAVDVAEKSINASGAVSVGLGILGGGLIVGGKILNNISSDLSQEKMKKAQCTR